MNSLEERTPLLKYMSKGIVANRPGSSWTVLEIVAVYGKASQVSRYCSYKYSDVIVNYIIALGVGKNMCCGYVFLVLSFHVVEQLVQTNLQLYIL